MARVTILTHSEFVHAKSGVHFHPELVDNGEGAKVYLGVATVPDAVARTYFATHPSFRVEGLAPAEGEDGEKGTDLDELKLDELKALAGEKGIAVEAITGTGPGGRVTKKDIIAAIAAAAGDDTQAPAE